MPSTSVVFLSWAVLVVDRGEIAAPVARIPLVPLQRD
jgi:hypothetical protein